MKYKSIAELYQEQYNKSVDWEIAYPIWDYFQVDYKQLSTVDLLDILHSTRVSNMNKLWQSIINEPHSKFNNIVSALKRELATREHIVKCKQESKKLRQFKASKHNKK